MCTSSVIPLFLLLAPFQLISAFKDVYPNPIRLPLGPGPDMSEPLILTPFIEAGEIQEAHRLSRVKNLTNVVSYSGYFNVNPEYDSNLFFWFFPAAFNPDNAPVLLWLQGGPGSSSLLGLFNENGPFIIDALNNVHLRSTSWSLTHSVLYIDNPVGTGYSFTKDDRGYAKDQSDVARDLYLAMVQFFLLFPKYYPNDFYITGESYAGKYIPALAYRIHLENHNKPPIKINLKGMSIGDGFIDPLSMLDYGNYLYNIGLLDYNSKGYFDQEEERARQFILQGKYVEAYHVMDQLFLGWDTEPTYYTRKTGFRRYYNYLVNQPRPAMNYYSSFVQQDNVRHSIHVGNVTFCDGDMKAKVETYLQQDIYKSVKPWVEHLLNATENYRVLIYNGQLDIIVSNTLTDNFLRSLNWKNSSEFLNAPRYLWKVNNELAGYGKTVGSFTQLVVRNAGHLVPTDQPEWSFDMINRFTAGKSFESN